MKTETIKENVIAILIAFVLAFGVFFLFNNSSSLKADIMGTEGDTQDKEAVIEMAGDVLYQIEDGKLSMKSNRNFSGVETMSFFVIYSPEAVSLSLMDIQSKYDVGGEKQEGKLNIILSNLGEISEGDELVSFDYDYEEELMTISDMTVNFTDTTVEKLSISKK